MDQEEKHMELFCLVMTETFGAYSIGLAKVYKVQLCINFS